MLSRYDLGCERWHLAVHLLDALFLNDEGHAAAGELSDFGADAVSVLCLSQASSIQTSATAVERRRYVVSSSRYYSVIGKWHDRSCSCHFKSILEWLSVLMSFKKHVGFHVFRLEVQLQNGSHNLNKRSPRL